MIVINYKNYMLTFEVNLLKIILIESELLVVICGLGCFRRIESPNELSRQKSSLSHVYKQNYLLYSYLAVNDKNKICFFLRKNIFCASFARH